ncbi:hypothetical protein INS49_015671 [Diaporthe citri]|uniref:uncharacterized protein n=1 Tax=Diaporthe citri TaxID=83186 RepID=UPI001C8277F9|nr:uncharacterized protein INS49_015671 [Diaporthe citri]KAG6356284.1 hypothetical protein INS49_015671 [Diaporthe citri]
MAQDPGACLDRLPDELLLGIIEQSCRRNHKIAISTAYERHIKEENGLATRADNTPQVYWAIGNEQHGTLKWLVENGVDVNMRDEKTFGSPLDIGLLFRVHGLEKTKAFMEPRFEARISPLAWAAFHGHDSMVGYLLDHGADVGQTSEKLCSCCDSKLLHCPRRLPDPLEFYSRDPDDDDDSIVDNGGCWVDPGDSIPEWKPLHYALCNEHESTARLLIERGADANNVGAYHGVTALHVATRWGLDNTIDYLLDNDCVDINAQSSQGVTALHMAQVAGRDDLVDKYLDRGADINLEYSDRSGPWTIFYMACAAGDYERALEYLKRGADLHFVLEGEDRDPWTVMRLIYWSTDDAYECPMSRAYDRMKLEREIIARGKGSPANT